MGTFVSTELSKMIDQVEVDIQDIIRKLENPNVE